ncbi:MAG: DUF420 domain-containing protein [Bacteroidota bacterium]
MEANLALEKKLNKWAWVITAVVLLLVSTMHRIPKIPTSLDFTFLPAVYSTLNAITAIILIVGLYFIKQKKIEQHKKAMTLAMFTSALFLAGYVVYHLIYEDTKYGGEGTIRYVYFFLLITHIILAAVIFPFILFTFIRAFTNQIDRHKKMARWVYWLWLYVAITGPVLFLMIRPYYPWVQ